MKQELIRWQSFIPQNKLQS